MPSFSRHQKKLDGFFLQIFILFPPTFLSMQSFSWWREKLGGFFLVAIFPHLLPLHLLCFFRVFPICDLCCRLKSHQTSFGTEKSSMGFVSRKFIIFFFFSLLIMCDVHSKKTCWAPSTPKKTRKVFLEFFFHFQSLIYLFSLANFNPYNSNGGQ